MKHVPERTCCACGAKRPQRELLRIASVGGTAPVLDREGKAPGRGSYLCLQSACAEKALMRKALERTLKLNEPLGDEFKTELKRVVQNETASAAASGDNVASGSNRV